MYNLLRSFLFLFDAEKVHHFSMNGLKLLCKIGWIKKIITLQYSGCELEVKGYGLNTSSPATHNPKFTAPVNYIP